MTPYSTILPLVFLGGLTGAFAMLLVYHWVRRSRLRSIMARMEESGFEETESPPMTLPVRTGTKKMKIPKLWDVLILNMKGSASHIRRASSDTDLDDVAMKYASTWNKIKPISVAYIKRAEIPLTLSSASFLSDPQGEEITLNRSTSAIVAYGQGESVEKGSGYDKSAVEAVQVSVLISMPGETAGPSALGIAKVSLDNGGRWRQSRRVFPI